MKHINEVLREAVRRIDEVARKEHGNKEIEKLREIINQPTEKAMSNKITIAIEPFEFYPAYAIDKHGLPCEISSEEWKHIKRVLDDWSDVQARLEILYRAAEHAEREEGEE